ncbi:MAG TPA: methyltransferase domain-containing protein [Acidimicrobiales bacterium]|nr:methyltransferase domain-containing protein [Acidimicrobiales bacterium]
MTSADREWDASTYDRVADPMTRWGTKVLERLVLTGDETVLDVGCGTGRVTELLLERLPEGRVIANDVSVAMLETAASRLASNGERVRLLGGDVLELGPDDLDGWAPVDAVLSTATFHWVLDHDRLFPTLAGLMAPGAQLVAQCGAAGNIDGLMAAVRATGNERAGAWYYATPAATLHRLEAAGFVDVEVWTHPEPTRIEPRAELEAYLDTVCLRTHVSSLPEAERAGFVAAVADAMPDPVIDYVRLNIVARRG